MKRRIDFQKLANREYGLSVELFMINWMLKTGIPYSERFGRWYVEGVSKFILGYSANNHKEDAIYTQPLYTGNIDVQVDGILLRALVKTTNIECVNKWREDERIGLDRHRYFDINEDRPPRRTWYLGSEIRKLNDFVGKDLNPLKYNDRIYLNPRISYIYLHVNGSGYCVDCSISYQSENYKFDYTSSALRFRQQKKESVDMFIYRVHESINADILVKEEQS